MAVKQADVALDDIQRGLLPHSWPEIVKEDWQNKTNGINQTAEVANEANVTANSEKDRNDQQDVTIRGNSKGLLLVGQEISVIDRKTNLIALDVAENKKGIADNKQNLTDHENETSAHGVKGNNVGTEDFAQSLVGGVVLIASNLAELEALTLSIPSAPGEYSQEYMQTVANGINSLVSKQGDIITLINEALRGQKDAKQMQPDAPVGE